MPKFGTSGLRGLAADLTDALCAGYAQAFLEGAPHDGTLLIGRDLRDSSIRLRDAVAAGAARLGIGVIDCGILPTPALALAAARRGTAAIMVTGSHIPADRNGLKFYTSAGEITKADEARITAGFAALPRTLPLSVPETSRMTEAHTAFHDRYRRFFADAPLGGLRVGVYQHSSVARDLLAELLADLGAEPVPFGRSDTFVPVDTEAVDPEMRAMLADQARDHRLDAIVSTDGDADRPMVADDAGRIVPGDVLGPLTARFLGARTIVTPVSSNTNVELCGAFETVARCRIGSPFVIDRMETLRAEGKDAIVGYEANGGFLLGFGATRAGETLAPLMTRDFALPILATLVLMRDGGLTLAALLDTLPRRYTATDRLTDIAPEVSARLVDRVRAGDMALVPDGHGGIASEDMTDGARLTLADGTIFHVRPSGNAPELRCYIEADTEATAREALASALGRLSNAI